MTGTVMFTDLRSFTAFAETTPAERVIDVLNRYLGDMGGAVLDHGGTLVAYTGDGLLAGFGAPIPSEDHADRAVAATGEMIRESVFPPSTSGSLPKDYATGSAWASA